jgi:hypothetical protein
MMVSVARDDDFAREAMMALDDIWMSGVEGLSRQRAGVLRRGSVVGLELDDVHGPTCVAALLMIVNT